MSFWSEKTATARKVHHCDECSCAIQVGERYVSGAGINIEGDFGTWKSHEDCNAATQENRKLADLMPDEWSCVSEWIWDMPAEALPDFARSYPGVLERFRTALIKHGRWPEGVATKSAADGEASKPKARATEPKSSIPANHTEESKP